MAAEEHVAFQGEYVGRSGVGAVTYILRVCAVAPSGDLLLLLFCKNVFIDCPVCDWNPKTFQHLLVSHARLPKYFHSS